MLRLDAFLSYDMHKALVFSYQVININWEQFWLISFIFLIVFTWYTTTWRLSCSWWTNIGWRSTAATWIYNCWLKWIVSVFDSQNLCIFLYGLVDWFICLSIFYHTDFGLVIMAVIPKYLDFFLWHCLCDVYDDSLFNSDVSI